MKTAVIRIASVCAGLALGGSVLVTPALAATQTWGTPTHNSYPLVCDRWNPNCLTDQWNYVNGNSYGYGYNQPSYSYTNYNSYNYNYPTNYGPTYGYPNYYPVTTLYTTPGYNYQYQYQYQYQYNSYPNYSYSYQYPSYHYWGY